MSFHKSGHRRTLVRRTVGLGPREEVNVILLAAATTAGTIAKAAWPARAATRPPAAASFRRSGIIRASAGASVTGGLVYRGSRYSGLVGRYVFADFVSGRVWSLDSRRPLAVSADRVRQLLTDAGITSFALDPSTGDLLLCDLMEGAIKRLVATDSGSAPPPPATLSATGAFSDVARLTRRRVVPYAPNASSGPITRPAPLCSRCRTRPAPFGFSPTGHGTLPTGACG